MTCHREGCLLEAELIIGLEFRQRDGAVIGRGATSVVLCEDHYRELEREGPLELLSGAELADVAADVTQVCGVACDPAAIVVCAFQPDDPTVRLAQRFGYIKGMAPDAVRQVH